MSKNKETRRCAFIHQDGGQCNKYSKDEFCYHHREGQVEWPVKNQCQGTNRHGNQCRKLVEGRKFCPHHELQQFPDRLEREVRWDDLHVWSEQNPHWLWSVVVGQDGWALFMHIWNEGIDSRLEAFARSRAWPIWQYPGASRFHLAPQNEDMEFKMLYLFHPDEIQILIRRLLEYETEEAEQWATDIVEHIWQIEEKEFPE